MDITLQSGKRRTFRYEVIPQNLLEQIAEDQKDKELNRAIDDLPNQLGDIITLRFFRRRSYAEIGQALGLSETSVRRKLREALDLLK